MIIAADAESAYQGNSYLVFGSDSGFSSLDVNSLDGTNGLALALNDPNFDPGTVSVSGAGDINGDGFDDLVIGAASPFMSGDTNRQLRSYIVFGRESFAVPEPSSTVLLGTGLIGWMTRRRRR